MTRILIVEDETIVSRMYEKALKYDGFDIDSAVGGEEALKKIQESRPDCILLDIMMPGMNGIDLLETLKNDLALRSIPVIMLSNLSGEHDAKHALAKGASDYWIKKDTDINELGDKINALLGIQKKES